MNDLYLVSFGGLSSGPGIINTGMAAVSAGDRLLSAVSITGLGDVTSDFGSVAPAAGAIAQISASNLSSTAVVALMQKASA